LLDGVYWRYLQCLRRWLKGGGSYYSRFLLFTYGRIIHKVHIIPSIVLFPFFKEKKKRMSNPSLKQLAQSVRDDFEKGVVPEDEVSEVGSDMFGSDDGDHVADVQEVKEHPLNPEVAFVADDVATPARTDRVPVEVVVTAPVGEGDDAEEEEENEEEEEENEEEEQQEEDDEEDDETRRQKALQGTKNVPLTRGTCHDGTGKEFRKAPDYVAKEVAVKEYDANNCCLTPPPGIRQWFYNRYRAQGWKIQNWRKTGEWRKVLVALKAGGNDLPLSCKKKKRSLSNKEVFTAI